MNETRELESVLRTLDTCGILDGMNENNYRVGDGFESSVDEYRSCWDDLDIDELFAEVKTMVGSANLTTRLLDPAVGYPSLNHVYVFGALDERLQNTPVEFEIRIATLLATILRGSPPDRGNPNGFLPVHGEDLPGIVNAHKRAVLYFWRDDCEPCDAMRDAFEQIQESIPNDIGLFSIYGPDAAELIQIRYNVVGAPTTLFMLDGNVDSRLVEAQYPSVVESEIEKLHERG